MRFRFTYDDGPGPWTIPVLNALDEKGEKATFFMRGDRVLKHPKIAQEVKARGHVIGNHTMNHKHLGMANYYDISDEITKCGKVLKDVVGEHSNLFRPPFGDVSSIVYMVARDLGLEVCLWEIVGIDWSGLMAEDIVLNVEKKLDDLVILLHDAGDKEDADRNQTVLATRELLRRFR